MGEHVCERRRDQTLSQPIGVAGCGRMGAPMLAALLDAKFDARGLDIRPASSFGSLASVMTTDAAQFSQGLETLITVVRDTNQTDDVLFGAQNLVARAENRRLSFMLGGATEALNIYQPLFDAMGAHFHRMGRFGAGMQAKVLNNLLAASHTVMTRLVLDWADHGDLDEANLLALIDTSSGQNWLASGFDDIEFARDGYGSDNSIGILKKDVESALDAAPKGADNRLPELLAAMLQDLPARK